MFRILFGNWTLVPNFSKLCSQNLVHHKEIGYSDQNDNTVNSIDDCIDGIEEPLYGFRVNIKLVEDESCIMGQTCKGTPNDIGEGKFYK